jgi:hypothetical protein
MPSEAVTMNSSAWESAHMTPWPPCHPEASRLSDKATG